MNFLSVPVRQTTPVSRSQVLPEQVPLLRDLALASYQAVCSNPVPFRQLVRKQRTSGTSRLATICELKSQSSQRTESAYGTSSPEDFPQSGTSSSDNSEQNGTSRDVTSDDVPSNSLAS
jgi:hypothetical protein